MNDLSSTFTNMQIIKKGNKPAFAVLPYDEVMALREFAEDMLDKQTLDKIEKEKVPVQYHSQEEVDKLLGIG